MLEPFERHKGTVFVVDQNNVDTDQILPARFLHRRRRDGFGDALFADLDISNRTGDHERRFGNASVLVAGKNFGCGSSREHAVWALADGGFRVIIAPSFGDIFYNNALQNGLLAIELPASAITKLINQIASDTGTEVETLLEPQKVGFGNDAYDFEIEPFRKEALRSGLTQIDMTLLLLDEIEKFERQDEAIRPWLMRSVKRLDDKSSNQAVNARPGN